MDAPVKTPSETAVLSTAKQGLPFVGIQELIARAKNGDPMALESIKITAEYLGEGISNLVHGLYPEAVVIGGNITAAWSIIEPILRARLRSKYVVNPEQILIRPASVQRPSLFGAIPIALQNYFKSPTSPHALTAAKV